MKKPEPQKVTAPNDANRHLKILIAIGLFWLVAFGIVMIEHARSWARLLPLIAIAFVAYGIYATVKIFRNKRNQ